MWEMVSFRSVKSGFVSIRYPSARPGGTEGLCLFGKIKILSIRTGEKSSYQVAAPLHAPNQM